MTTIAWDGKTLAADRQITYDKTVEGEVTKIYKRKKDGALCAVAGNLPIAIRFVRWFLAGGKGEPPELEKGTATATSFVIYSPELMVKYSNTGWYEVELPNPFADGSGWELALGAMAAGATAEQAVHIASRFDTATGKNIDTLELGK